MVAALLAVPWLPAYSDVARYAWGLAGVTALAAVLLGWRFGQGRLVLAVAVVGVAAALPLLASADARAAGAGIVAVDLVLLAWLPERGLLTWRGLARSALLLGQAACIAWIGIGAAPFGVPQELTTPVGSVPLTLVVYGAAVAVLALRVLRGDDSIERGLLWAAVALLAGSGAPGDAAWLLVTGVAVLLTAGLEHIHRLAFLDALTALPSRRALEERLRRLRGRYTVAMVDVDHFKKFNDRHGHDVGDQVLRMVAARLRETAGARAYRYGGEEFTLLFPGRTRADVRDRLEDARARVGEHDFVVRGAGRPKTKPRRPMSILRPRQTLRVTVSMGAAEREGREKAHEVLARADAALYRAKQRGRNRVVA
ncbi:MAG: diguanylate cyclase [Gemmatimonadota bacterium]